MEETFCSYIKEDGEQCNARPVKGSKYCFSHNPDTKIEKHMAVVKGGLNSRKTNMELEALSIKSPSEISILLEETINGVRSGEIPPNIANTIGYLAGHALKAFEVSKLNDKVELIQRVILEKKTKY